MKFAAASVDGEQWFYAGEERVPVGPFSLSELRNLESEGTIDHSTLVVERGGNAWKPWGEVQAGTVETLAPPPASSFAGRWFGKTLIVILLVLLPPVGLALLWSVDWFSTRAREWASVVGVLWFYITVFNAGTFNAFVSATLTLGVAAGIAAAWRRWGRKRIPAPQTAAAPDARRAGKLLVVATALLTILCAPLAILLALFSTRFTRSEKAAVAVVGIAWMGLISLVVLVNSDSDEKSVVATSATAHQTDPEDIPPVETESVRVEPVRPLSRDKTPSPQQTEQGLKIAQQHAETLSAILDEIERIPNALIADPQQAPMLIGVARRARMTAEAMRKDVENRIEPMFDGFGGEFAFLGGRVGNALNGAVIQTNTAASFLAGSLATDLSESSLKSIGMMTGSAHAALRELREGIDAVKNPGAAQVKQREEDELTARVHERLAKRDREKPGPKPNASAQPYRIADSLIEENTPPRIGSKGSVTIVAPAAQCFEEYALTTKQAADDFQKAHGCTTVECVLLPSPASDNLFALAIARVSWVPETGRQRWEVMASRQRLTKEEVAIAEAWKKARAQAPSQLTDDIQAVMVSEYGLSMEDILSVPSAFLESAN